MRLSRAIRLRVLVPAVVCGLALPGGGAAGAAKALTPKETIRAYVAAINAKNGQKLCALLHPLEAKAVGAHLAAIYSTEKQTIPPVPCRVLARSIGSGGGRDNSPRWTRTKIVHMDAAKTGERGMLSIDVEFRDTWGGGSPSTDTRWTRFYLARYHGRYVILRHSSTLDQAMWSETLDGADAPPATSEPRHEDVQIPAVMQDCGAPTWTKSDAVGDGRSAGVPSLDLRSISLTQGPVACVTLEFDAPLLPGTEIETYIGGSWGTTLYILADGQVYDDPYDDDEKVVPGVDFGLVGDRTLVLRFENGATPQIALSVIVDNLSFSEPLIHTQPKILGGDYFSSAD
jgi:hypothetical protein